jgi:hypothetical protein
MHLMLCKKGGSGPRTSQNETDSLTRLRVCFDDSIA